MPGNDGKPSPVDREDVDIPGDNDQDRPTPSDAADHGASAPGSEQENVSGDIANPPAETGGKQNTPSTTDEATAQEKDASAKDRDATPLPRQARPDEDEDADAEPRSTSAVQTGDPRWFPSAGAEALPSALSDDTASSSRQTGTEMRDSEGREHADIPAPREGGPRPGDPAASSPGDTAFTLGEEDEGLKNVSNLVSHAVPGPGFEANPRPLPPIPQAHGAAIPELPATDDHDLLPSLMARGSATPFSASGLASSRETGRYAERESSGWNIPDGRLEEGVPASMLGTDVPASLTVPGPGRAPEETQGGLPSENPSPGQVESQPNIVIHTPIPTRPMEFAILRSTACAPESLASNPPYPTTPPFRQQSRASSQGTATPTQDRFRAYKLEPPRQGRGFDHRRIRAPDPGTSARTHLFVTPQLLRTAEQERIIKAYNMAFDVTLDSAKTLLSKLHRYPGHTRDIAAQLRKLEFEAATGESMSEEEYYALFDLETSNDGMLSGLLEWMQGRNWIKVPFVNRIIHQVCRLMFTSAEEEARLRLRSQRDCDLLRRKLEAAEENAAMERAQNSWQRMDAAVRTQHLFAKANADGFRQPNDVERNCDRDAGIWDPLSLRFTSLLRARDDVEDGIEKRQGQIFDEDLNKLESIYRDLATLNKRTSDFMSVRNQKAEDPQLFKSNNRGTMEFLRFLSKDINDEERVRQSVTAKFLDIASCRMQSRGRRGFMLGQGVEDLPEPSIPAFLSPEMLSSESMSPLPQDPVPEGGPGSSGPASSQSSYKSPASSAASPSSPSQGLAYPPTDSYHTQANQPGADLGPDVTELSKKAQLMRPRGSCTRCQMLEKALEVGQKQIGECRRENQAQSNEVERLQQIIRAIDDKDMQAAFKHMDGYQDMVRADLRQALQFVLLVLGMEGQRARDETKALEASLQVWQGGKSMDNVVAELKPMARSVRQLATAVSDVVSRLTGQLEKVDSEKEVRLQLLNENDSQRRSLERLRKEMKDMEANATEAAKTIELQMQEESDRLKDQIRKCESEIKVLRKEHEEREKDAPQTADSSIQDLKDQLEKKETELSKLKAEKKGLEEQLKVTRDKLEALSKATEKKDEQVKDLEKHIKHLLIQLKAQDDAAKWYWGPHRQKNDANFENQDGDKIVHLRTELFKELGKSDSKPHQKFNTDIREWMPSLIRGVIWPKNTSAAKQAHDEDSKMFWRVAAFSRMRGEAVAALKRGDLEDASERLESLQVWNTKMGPWESEAQKAEVLRSINFLSSYVNLELRKAEGFSKGSSEKLMTARQFFSQGLHFPETDGHRSWAFMRNHLDCQLGRSGEEKPVCECEYKQRICAKHKRGGAKYHNFMEMEEEEEEEDGDAQEPVIELTQEAYRSLRNHAFTVGGQDG
ncbi:hypothetical protein LX32DRAFT_632285 [Colletotrichum zoysiae]|uniref:Uncharacterized protein n=1 Tax=Colletotrichum zoysiae TaxID=1216348 RepID=A0AAD9LTV7_9PEZI|nr:hypothetical protein LX32DRAFT_632285 [Colletotrichum zoysiae]